jgi:hypothetical protein
MGLRAQDITPLSATGPSVLIPTSKDLVTKTFSVARTDTASTLKAVLPADATILSIQKSVGVNTDSATSSTVTLTVANNGGTVSTGSSDVKAGGATAGFVGMSNLPNIEPVPLTGDLRISAQYAEVGASTTGGPWYYTVIYVR